MPVGLDWVNMDEINMSVFLAVLLRENRNHTYHIQPNYHTYPYKRTVKHFLSLQITASALFVYFFIKAYVLGTHLNAVIRLNTVYGKMPNYYWIWQNIDEIGKVRMDMWRENMYMYTGKSYSERIWVLDSLQNANGYITKTCLFKYIENLTTNKGKFSDKKFRYFSYFCSKHRLWVLVRTASVRQF